MPATLERPLEAIARSTVRHQVVPTVSAHARLEQAERLGYLRCDHPMGKLSRLWLDRCQSRLIPYIAFAPRDKGRSYELQYMMPLDDPYVLNQGALSELKDRITRARDPKARSRPWVTSSQGAISGLRPEAVEAVAFYLSEDLNDPNKLRNTEREDG